MDTTDNMKSPKRRIEDQAQAATLNWDAPGAPAVPAAPPAPARIPLRAVASMCVKPDDISFFPTAAGKLLEPGHYMLSVQGAAIACTDASAVPAAGESKAQLQEAVPSAGTTANPDGSTSTIVTERERQLENYLAELRDMFQTPEDDELHALWMEAWTDPEYVAPYVKAQFAKLTRQQAAPAAPTKISGQLREFASNPGYSHGDYADVMRRAADECDRFYSGMMAWKQTAEKKDRDWNEARMARENDRVAARLAAPAAIPENYVLMPTRLTAENGAKGALSGEFVESVTVPCHECEGVGEVNDGQQCAECDGEGTVEQRVAVEWDTIKRIYARAVALLAAAPAAPAHPAPIEAQGLAKQFCYPAIAPAASGDERAMFEAWAREQGMSEDDLKRVFEGRYFWSHTTDAWEAWSARAAVSAATKPALLDHAHAEPTEKFERMFLAACADLGLINEALGLDPDDGGADPILDAIEELKAAAAAGEVSQGAAPTAADVWDAALEKAATALRSLKSRISDASIIGFDRYDSAHNAIDNGEIAIRALKRAAQPNIQEAGNA